MRRIPFQRPLVLSIVTSIFGDRASRAMLSCIWDGWRESLVMVKPSTVWHGIARSLALLAVEE